MRTLPTDVLVYVSCAAGLTMYDLFLFLKVLRDIRANEKVSLPFRVAIHLYTAFVSAILTGAADVVATTLLQFPGFSDTFHMILCRLKLVGYAISLQAFLFFVLYRLERIFNESVDFRLSRCFFFGAQAVYIVYILTFVPLWIYHWKLEYIGPSRFCVVTDQNMIWIILCGCTVTSFVLTMCGMFIYKLQKVRSSITSSRLTGASFNRLRALDRLSAKYSILTFFALATFLGTISAALARNPYVAAQAIFDTSSNLTCLILGFKFNEWWYYMLCGRLECCCNWEDPPDRRESRVRASKSIAHSESPMATTTMNTLELTNIAHDASASGSVSN